jgi:hypothetical protein
MFRMTHPDTEKKVDNSITNFVNVRNRARELGLPPVAEFAMLPAGFETAPSNAELTRVSEAATLRKLFKGAGLDVQELQPAEKLATSVTKSADWIAPTLFIGSMLYTQNHAAVDIALDVISHYAYDFLKGRLPSGKVKISFVVERSKSKECKRFTYEGSVSGLTAIAPELRKLQNE